MIFFRILSLITKGLRSAILFKDCGNVSNGKIVLEKNKKRLAALIVPSIDVSSDLNKYPINMPIKIKTPTTGNKAMAIFHKSTNNVS